MLRLDVIEAKNWKKYATPPPTTTTTTKQDELTRRASPPAILSSRTKHTQLEERRTRAVQGWATGRGRSYGKR